MGGAIRWRTRDSAAGVDRVLILQPDIPPFPVLESLDEQVERLQRAGAQVKVIRPDEAMKTALEKAGGNALDPSLRGTGSQIGCEQGIHEMADVATFWN